MKREKTTFATILFIFGILLAGIANAASRQIIKTYAEAPDSLTAAPFISTLLFCANLLIYLFLAVFWIHSVQYRLLPSRARNYLITAALCAVMMLVLRSVKYRLLDGWALDAQRYVWYLYYVPMILMPTLFLMTCIRIENRNRPVRFDERFLLIPASVLTVLFLTNDLHYFAFRSNGVNIMTGANATYYNNWLLYVYYAYWGVTISTGLVLLVRANRRLHSFKKTVLPFLFPLIMLSLFLVDITLNWVRLPSMFTVPEIVSFGMIGIFESCIRNRLIPYNENYNSFFALMRFPAVITDNGLSVVHSSAEPVDAAHGQLCSAVSAPVYLDADTKLTGKRITAGYTFYTEDESELHRMREKLTDANELIASENDMIEAENELRSRKAQVDSRNYIYERISVKMLPYHRKALEMLDEMQPGAPDFAEKIARLNLLNAYIKRGTNLLLTNEGKENIPLTELGIAVEEYSRYLSYCNVQASVTSDKDEMIPRDEAFDLFTEFYETADALTDQITMLHIAVNGDCMRLIADCETRPELPSYAKVKESDGLYFIALSAQKGGAL